MYQRSSSQARQQVPGCTYLPGVQMTPARPAAVVLALVAGRVASFVHLPVFSSPRPIAGSTYKRAVRPQASKAATLSAAAMTTTTTASCRCNTARMLMRMRGATQQSRLLPNHHRPAAFGRQKTAAAPTNAGQLVTVRTLSTTRRTMPNTAVLAAGQQQQPAGGRPAGGYPPPEHLHGIFAVYKPKGFSSADVVQKIKVRFERVGDCMYWNYESGRDTQQAIARVSNNSGMV